MNKNHYIQVYAQFINVHNLNLYSITRKQFMCQNEMIIEYVLIYYFSIYPFAKVINIYKYILIFNAKDYYPCNKIKKFKTIYLKQN